MNNLTNMGELGGFVDLPEVIGKGYGEFWRFRGRYRVVKGSRASKKSKTAALWLICNIMKYPDANALVIRKVFDKLAASCFVELKWAINALGVSKAWRVCKSPLEMVYIKTGQKILFRGLDNAENLTSIAVEFGQLCWVWVEEAFQLTSQKEFEMLDECIRGESPPGLFKQITLIFNPWNEHHWLKSKFFDLNEGEEIVREVRGGFIKRAEVNGHSVETFAITTNYTCNEWLDDADRALFATMAEQNPRRYQVAGLGEWGISDGLIFERIKVETFDIGKTMRHEGAKAIFGLDFGYTNDPTALFCGIIVPNEKRLYVFDELYGTHMSNEAIFREVERKGFARELITADSSEPKSIDRLRALGLTRLRGAAKGPDSINAGIDFLQDFEIIALPRCENFVKEAYNYRWAEDKAGNKLNKPVDDYNHLMDAMRYACEDFTRVRGYREWSKRQ